MLAKLGFSIVHANGCIVAAKNASQEQESVEAEIQTNETQDRYASMQETAETVGSVDSTVNGVWAVCVPPGQSKVAKVNAISNTDDSVRAMA